MARRKAGPSPSSRSILPESKPLSICMKPGARALGEMIDYVMPGLGPGIHEFAPSCRKERVDAKPKAWHDDRSVGAAGEGSPQPSIAVDGRAGGVVDGAQPGFRLVAVGVEVVV